MRIATAATLLKRMRAAKKGSSVVAEMPPFGTAQWVKESDDAEALWVFQATDSRREPKELSSMLFDINSDFINVEIRKPWVPR